MPFGMFEFAVMGVEFSLIPLRGGDDEVDFGEPPLYATKLFGDRDDVVDNDEEDITEPEDDVR